MREDAPDPDSDEIAILAVIENPLLELGKSPIFAPARDPGCPDPSYRSVPVPPP
jgi:hypothetical protein